MTLNNDAPLSARLGLEHEDALSASLITSANNDEAHQLARGMLVHALLPLALEPINERQAFSLRVTTALIPDTNQFKSKVLKQIAKENHYSHQRYARWRLIAAGGALAASLIITILLLREPTPIALLTKSSSAVWLSAPASLQAGSILQLERGLAEIDLNGRGQIIIEGPAQLELIDDMHASLHHGSLTVHVTPAGHGYRIDTPSGTVIDLGTRFGVRVTDDGTTETHVLEGEIIAKTTTKASNVILRKDNAARLQNGRIETVAFDRGAFYTTLPPVTNHKQDFIYWRLNEGSGSISRAESRGFLDEKTDLQLMSAHGAPVPQWIPGHTGYALNFDGRGGYAESDFPGITGIQARTLACWIRMPRDFALNEGFAIVSWGQFSPNLLGAVWQLSLNPIAKAGPLGRIRIGTHGGFLVGTTDLRDDTWHHVAVVMYGGANPTIGTHVLMYVDGELEKISGRTVRAIDTQFDARGHGVWVGRNITYKNETKPHPHGGFLRGAVDDIIITNGAMTAQEIRLLFEASTTP